MLFQHLSLRCQGLRHTRCVQLITVDAMASKSKTLTLTFFLSIAAIGVISFGGHTARSLYSTPSNTENLSSVESLLPRATKPLPAQMGKSISAQKVDSVEVMVERLRARLEHEPNDMNGWVLLGRSYHFMQRWSDAKAAFAKARELGYQEADAATEGGAPMSEPLQIDTVAPGAGEATSVDNEIFSDIARAASRSK